jgi:hypothetical protein
MKKKNNPSCIGIFYYKKALPKEKAQSGKFNS